MHYLRQGFPRAIKLVINLVVADKGWATGDGMGGGDEKSRARLREIARDFRRLNCDDQYVDSSPSVFLFRLLAPLASRLNFVAGAPGAGRRCLKSVTPDDFLQSTSDFDFFAISRSCSFPDQTFHLGHPYVYECYTQPPVSISLRAARGWGHLEDFRSRFVRVRREGRAKPA